MSRPLRWCFYSFSLPLPSPSYPLPRHPRPLQDAWEPISPSARDLIVKMLTVDESKRATMAQVLEHPWITSTAPTQVAHLPRTLDNLRRLNVRRKIRAAAAAVRLGAAAGHVMRAKVATLMEGRTLSASTLTGLSAAFQTAAGGGAAVDFAQFEAVMSSLGAVVADLPLRRLFEVFGASLPR